jgi:hypothetical protein
LKTRIDQDFKVLMKRGRDFIEFSKVHPGYFMENELEGS